MTQLITLSKLASLVSEYSGIEVKVCEAFIRNMAQATASALIEGEHISISGFGYFERCSVDGTTSVNFIPDDQFAARVNAPFAHMSPSELPNQQANMQPAQQQPSFPPRPSYPQQPAMPQAPSYPRQPETPAYGRQQFPQQPETPAYGRQQFPQQPETPAYGRQQFPQQPETPAYGRQQFPQQPETPAYAQQQFPQQPETPAYAQQQFPQQPETPAYAQQPFPQQPETPFFPNQAPEFPPVTPSAQQDSDRVLPSYLNPTQESQTEPESSPSTDTFDYGRQHPTGYNRQLPQISTNNKYILIGVLGILVGFLLGYLTARYTSGESQAEPETNEESEAVNNIPTLPQPQEFDHDLSMSVADMDTLLEEENMPLDTPEDVSPQSQPESQSITVKLLKGQRLSDIAMKHYGKKEFWVYIYLENRSTISNPFTIREGTELRIPPKEKYAPTTDEASNLAWAKSKAAEINRKYIN